MSYTSQFTGAEIDARLLSVSENIEKIQNEISERTEADKQIVTTMQEHIDSLAESMSSTLSLRGRVSSVEELPTEASVGDLYLVGPEGADEADEYLYTQDECFQCVGRAGLTPEDYVCKDELADEVTARTEACDALDAKITVESEARSEVINALQAKDAQLEDDIASNADAIQILTENAPEDHDTMKEAADKWALSAEVLVAISDRIGAIEETVIGYHGYPTQYITFINNISGEYGNPEEVCASITEVVIPDGVTELSGDFMAYTKLTKVTIPEGVTNIPDNCFLGCTSLRSITIPSTLKSIGVSAFSDCGGLGKFVIPDSVTDVAAYAFENSYSLTSITISSNMTVLEDALFSGCSWLSEVNIPSGITTIKDRVFELCPYLRTISIPDTVTTISSTAFDRSTNLKTITIDRPEDSISGAPWGATNATVTWTG